MVAQMACDGLQLRWNVLQYVLIMNAQFRQRELAQLHLRQNSDLQIRQNGLQMRRICSSFLQNS